MKWKETVAGIASIVLMLAVVVGYILNIVTLLSDEPMTTGELIVRAVGMFIVPIGAVAGYF